MPTIPIHRLFGLSLDGSLAGDAALPSLLPRFFQISELPLDKVPVSELSAGLKFNRPVDLVEDKLQFTFGASGGGRLALLRPADRALDEDDPFGEVPIADAEMYVAIGLDFALEAGVGGEAAAASFGLTKEFSLGLSAYRRFRRSANAFPRFAEALGVTAASFRLPRKAAELAEIAEETVLVIAGSGSLTLSGAFSLALPVETLASVSAGPAKLEVNAGASVGVDARLTVSGGYQVRLRKTGPRAVEIGVYKMKSEERALAVTAAAGISAKAGGFDLGEQILRAINRQPVVDAGEFRKALPGEDDDAKQRRIEAFEASLKSAISTRLQVALTAAFSRLKSNEAALLFEIDLDAAVTAQTQAAIEAALSGDFSGLAAGPAGVSQKANILTLSDVRTQSLKLNLLGIVNVLSVTKIAQISVVERNAQGEITLVTDTASVSRLRVLL
ncbi:MAG: hypothetical protein ACRD44_11835, partial [Bryobacteraceae bacterium]